MSKMNYIRISEFANICGTTSRTIRFYDTVGILKADYIDPSSGYRYYSKEKVLEFHKITSLKQIGFTIEEIRTNLLDASDLDILQILREKAKSLSDAHENCVKTISEYEERVKMYNETTRCVDIIKNTETNTIMIGRLGIEESLFTIRCLEKDLDRCYNTFWQFINVSSFFNLGADEVREVLESPNAVQVGCGSAKGETKALRAAAAEEACKNLSLSSGILIGMVVSSPVGLPEIEEAAAIIKKNLAAPNAHVILGVAFSEDLQNQLDITIIARK